jgi:hypothetical protein
MQLGGAIFDGMILTASITGNAQSNTMLRFSKNARSEVILRKFRQAHIRRM